MMKKINFVFLFFLAVACSQQSSIKPLFEARTVSEQQGRSDGLSVYTAKYNFNSDVASPTDVRLPIPLVGLVFREITNSIGNMVLNIQTTRDVDLDQFEFEIPELDYDLVREIKIKKIYFKVDPEYADESSFKFIESIDVFTYSDDTKGMTKEELEERNAIRIADYRMSDRSYNCQSKRCMEIKAYDINLVSVMRNHTKLYFRPYMGIKKVPKKTFKFSGYIEFELKVHLPF